MTVKTAPPSRSPARTATAAKPTAPPADQPKRTAAAAPKRATTAAPVKVAKVAKVAKAAKVTKPVKEGALSVEQLVALKEALGFADYQAMAKALGLSEVSVKRMMTRTQSVTKQVAFVLLTLRYFRDHPRAAPQFDQFLLSYSKDLPKVS